MFGFFFAFVLPIYINNAIGYGYLQLTSPQELAAKAVRLASLNFQLLRWLLDADRRSWYLFYLGQQRA